MDVKDYYSILKIPPNATPQMVKKAYRQLALVTHPDKQPNNPNAIAEFQLIHEAFTVLTTPSLKEAYLSQRWYYKSQNLKFQDPLHTPDALLSHLIKLSETYRFKNIYQIDYDQLVVQLHKILSNSALPDLSNIDQSAYRTAFTKTFISLIELLPYASVISVIETLTSKLPVNSSETQELQSLLREKRLEAVWGRYKYLFVLLMVVFFILWMLISR